MKTLTANGYMMLPKEQRAAVDAWVRSHGFEPNEVAAFTIAGPVVTFSVIELKDGRPFARDGEIAKRQVRKPASAAPKLDRWL